MVPRSFELMEFFHLALLRLFSIIQVQPLSLADMVAPKTVERAAHKVGGFTYGDFKEQVLPYLPGELMDVYRGAQAFLRQKIEVEQALLAMRL